MGVLAGYHLGLGGAQIAYLVRPARAARLPETLSLYSYDDARTHRFGDYAVITDPARIAELRPDFVVVTLDGAALTGAEGMDMLSAIGTAIRPDDTTLIIGSLGIGLRERVVAASGLPEHRVILGGLTMLAHQADAAILPIHAPTDPSQLQAADFAFRHLNDGGFRLEDRNLEAAVRFAAIFDRSGIGKCAIMSPDEFGVQSRGIMPLFIACQILDWPDADALYANPLWPIAVDAVRAIQGLAEHGAAGKTAAAGLTSERLAGVWNYLTAAALPLDWQGFNAFHHGSKINASDIRLLRDCVEWGDAEHRDMKAVKQIIARWEAL